jgi:FkbM family methyltransferase
MSRLSLVKQSLRLDSRLLNARGRTLGWKVGFVARKYLVLSQLRRGPARFAVSPLGLTVRDLSGLGSLQSSIVDFHDDIVAPGILRGNPFIVDVGANIGQFVNAAKLFIPSAQVMCFEPDPDTFADLTVNTQGLDQVELHNVGLGAADEQLPFHRHTLSLMSTFRDGVEKEHDRGTVELRVRRLDEVVEPERCPDLLKIDVEGFEGAVLEGGWKTLLRSRYLLIELSLQRSGGRENMQLLRSISEHAPRAVIVRFGRPFGEAEHPLCQDVLIAVDPMAG